MRDRAFWISWYDLSPEDRQEHLDWLHRRYIPLVAERPGVLWAAHYVADAAAVPLGGGKGRVKLHAPAELPGGSQFVMIFAAEDPYIFADPGAEDFHAGLGDDDRRMIGQRRGERSNIMIEEARVDGPEAPAEETNGAPAPAIQLGSFNSLSPEAEFELAKWYARWRLPSMTELPGIVRVRKLVSVAGWAKHACFYEFTSLAMRKEHFIHYEDSHPDMAKWSVDVVSRLVHATPRPIVAERSWPPVA
jgi:hypothetical protein